MKGRFFFAHTVPTSNYEHDPRSGGTEMIAILPESVALRILEAKKNPEFRMRIIKELIKTGFNIQQTPARKRIWKL